MTRRLRKMASKIAAPFLKRAARAYIAGPELEDGLRTARRLEERGFASSIGFWDGEGDSPQSVAEACRRALAALPKLGFDCYFSIKAPALGYSRELMAEIVEVARASGTRLHFDSHGPETVDRTLDLIDRTLLAYSNLSLTVPGRWQRSLRDTEWALERKLPVRIVKGQWADDSVLDPREGFVRIVEHLAGRAGNAAVATHDPQLARESVERLCAAGTAVEMELLFGLPSRAPLHVAQELGLRARFYVPYGYAWLPYAFSQAQQNPRVLLWVLKDTILPHPLRGI